MKPNRKEITALISLMLSCILEIVLVILGILEINGIAAIICISLIVVCMGIFSVLVIFERKNIIKFLISYVLSVGILLTPYLIVLLFIGLL